MLNEHQENPEERRRMRTFFALWLSQTGSLLGTGLTGFVLGIWVYQTTGSVAQFTGVSAIALAGGLVLSPIAGALADRLDRRQMMAVGDLLASLRIVAVILLLLAGKLEVWHVYAAVIVRAVAEALQAPAYFASISMLVPHRHLGRANGMQQFGGAGARILAPALGGALLAWFELWQILLIDIATFVAAIVVLMMIHVPPATKSADPAARQASLWKNAFYGWRYILDRPAFLRLQLFFTLLNLATGFSVILVIPLVLSFAGVVEVGTVQAIAGAGGFLGGLVMTFWGGPKRRTTGILLFTPLIGLGLIVAGLRPSVATVATGAFLFSFSIPIVSSCYRAIWQSKVEPAVQGRVFAMQSVMARGSGPFALLLAGIVSDRLLEPRMSPGGGLAELFGPLIGVGEGRGMALLMFLAGVSLLFLSASFVGLGKFRRLEDELPDAHPEPSPISDTPGASS